MAHFFVGPRVGALFVEQGDADDADVASVVIFLGGVRFAYRTEAKGRHLPENGPQFFMPSFLSEASGHDN